MAADPERMPRPTSVEGTFGTQEERIKGQVLLRQH